MASNQFTNVDANIQKPDSFQNKPTVFIVNKTSHKNKPVHTKLITLKKDNSSENNISPKSLFILSPSSCLKTPEEILVAKLTLNIENFSKCNTNKDNAVLKEGRGLKLRFQQEVETKLIKKLQIPEVTYDRMKSEAVNYNHQITSHNISILEAQQRKNSKFEERPEAQPTTVKLFNQKTDSAITSSFHKPKSFTREEFVQQNFLKIYSPNQNIYTQSPGDTSKLHLKRSKKFVKIVDDNCTRIRKYQCHYCHDYFHVKSDLILHLAVHKPKQQGCVVCPKSFVQGNNNRSHIKIREEKKYVDVPKSFSPLEFVYQKFIKFIPNNQIDHTQPTEDKPNRDFQRNCDLKSGKNLGKIVANNCTVKNHSPSNQIGHTQPTEDKPNQDFQSIFDSRSSKNVVEIVANNCTVKNQCPYCHNCFGVKSDLLLHLQMHKGKRFLCSICHKYFDVKSDLLLHLDVRKGKQFVCSSCHKLFVHKNDLKSDLERKFCCELCKASFVQKSTLRTHMFVHTGEKRFSCFYCQKKFSRKFHMKEHTKVHFKEKPYSCSHCNKKFKQKSTLQNHLKSHLATKYFGCRNCCKTYKSLKTLSLHISSEHWNAEAYCTLCNLTLEQSLLKYHVRRHINEMVKRPSESKGRELGLLNLPVVSPLNSDDDQLKKHYVESNSALNFVDISTTTIKSESDSNESLSVKEEFDDENKEFYLEIEPDIGVKDLKDPLSL